jgi:DNA-binding NarL/FixJ family response regulator
MIRAAVIDGHPAMRAGIEAILARTPDIIVVAGTPGEPHAVEHALYRTAPDIVIVGDDPGRLDGVELVRLIKGLPPAPRVLLYTDGIEPAQVGAAMLAGADGLVDARCDAAALIAAVRAVARRERAFPELDVAALADRLASDDEAILQAGC